MQGLRHLARLNLFLMDEYLTEDFQLIAGSNPLSFRGHVRSRLLDNLPAEWRPRLYVPDPKRLREFEQQINQTGGVDMCYAGVGITGHLAFNGPLDGLDDADAFARLRTRIVGLPTTTRLIGSVTACRGNIARIPRFAVTVGMKEILSSHHMRVFLNRDWHSTGLRRMMFGPVTGEFPASLVQRHPSLTVHIVQHVLLPPEPSLK